MLKRYRAESVLALIFSAYLAVNAANLIIIGADVFDIEQSTSINILGFALAFGLTAIVFVALGALFYKRNWFHKAVLFGSAMLYAVPLAGIRGSGTFETALFCLAVALILIFVFLYCFRDGKNRHDGIPVNGLALIDSRRVLWIVVCVLFVVYTVVLSYSTIMRNRIFYASTFDFGIFAQMYENMAKTGLPITTVERNMELSHFAVHFSPIYYLFLPIYMIFRDANVLFVIQAAAVGAGIFPLILLAKKFKLPDFAAIAIGIVYLLYPTFAGGLFFDFHENKFLTVFILWLMYFIVTEKTMPIFVFAILILSVKEDSFIYVIAAGAYTAILPRIKWRFSLRASLRKQLRKARDYPREEFLALRNELKLAVSRWKIFRKNNKKDALDQNLTPQLPVNCYEQFPELKSLDGTEAEQQKNYLAVKKSRANIIIGAALILLAVGWFMFTVNYLKANGQGVMMYRYENFLAPGEESFTDIVLNVIKNPALLLNSIFDRSEKLSFVIYIFFPLVFLPFVSKKLNALILLLPLIIINLATDYLYQFDINYQYAYGSAAYLFFLTVLNLGDINANSVFVYKKQTSKREITSHKTHVKFRNRIDKTAPDAIKSTRVRVVKISLAMLMITILLFFSNNAKRIVLYPEMYYRANETYDETENLLAKIPMNASVTASTYLIPHLILREEVYMADVDGADYFDYDTDYLVNDLRQVNMHQYDRLLKEIEARGYKKVEAGTFIEIFKLTDS
ncbi:hypothetical protein FACS1894219_03770 [Clostridia bacterium]|nr:hypothetical protein FACS1894219_03770 [Clostridia bacterium]